MVLSHLKHRLCLDPLPPTHLPRALCPGLQRAGGQLSADQATQLPGILASLAAAARFADDSAAYASVAASASEQVAAEEEEAAVADRRRAHAQCVCVGSRGAGSTLGCCHAGVYPGKVRCGQIGATQSGQGDLPACLPALPPPHPLPPSALVPVPVPPRSPSAGRTCSPSSATPPSWQGERRMPLWVRGSVLRFPPPPRPCHRPRCRLGWEAGQQRRLALGLLAGRAATLAPAGRMLSWRSACCTSWERGRWRRTCARG